MSHIYRDYWFTKAGKEVIGKADEMIAMMRGDPPFGSGGGPEVIDLGGDGQQLPRETEGTNDGP